MGASLNRCDQKERGCSNLRVQHVSRLPGYRLRLWARDIGNKMTREHMRVFILSSSVFMYEFGKPISDLLLVITCQFGMSTIIQSIGIP